MCTPAQAEMLQTLEVETAAAVIWTSCAPAKSSEEAATARRVVLQFGVAEEKMMERLWGDNFFDPASKKWSKKHSGTATCKCAATSQVTTTPARGITCQSQFSIHDSSHG